MKKIILLVTGCWLLVTLLGCDAFVRKFTRKPKKENLPQEEMVVSPEEYKAEQLTKQDLYRQYFLFWKSWQDELIEALQNNSQKKQIGCLREAMNNLNELKPLLNENGQRRLEVYLSQLNDLLSEINKDLYGSYSANNVRSAQRIKRNILREFSYNKAKGYLSAFAPQ